MTPNICQLFQGFTKLLGKKLKMMVQFCSDTILQYMAKDDEDGNGLQLENVVLTFSSSAVESCKNHEKFVMVCSPFTNSLDVLLLVL